MRTRALEMDVRHDYQAQRFVAQARERGPIRLDRDEIEIRAQEAVTFARDHAMERNAVADVRDVWINAYRRNLGRTDYEAVRSEFSRRLESGEFITSPATIAHPPSRQSAWWKWKKKIFRP